MAKERFKLIREIPYGLFKDILQIANTLPGCDFSIIEKEYVGFLNVKHKGEINYLLSSVILKHYIIDVYFTPTNIRNEVAPINKECPEKSIIFENNNADKSIREFKKMDLSNGIFVTTDRNSVQFVCDFIKGIM